MQLQKWSNENNRGNGRVTAGREAAETGPKTMRRSFNSGFQVTRFDELLLSFA